MRLVGSDPLESGGCVDLSSGSCSTMEAPEIQIAPGPIPSQSQCGELVLWGVGERVQNSNGVPLTREQAWSAKKLPEIHPKARTPFNLDITFNIQASRSMNHHGDAHSSTSSHHNASYNVTAMGD